MGLKTRKIKVRYVFEGSVYVNNNLTKEEAKNVVRNSLGVMVGHISSSDNNIIDWDINLHPVKKTIQ